MSSHLSSVPHRSTRPCIDGSEWGDSGKQSAQGGSHDRAIDERDPASESGSIDSRIALHDSNQFEVKLDYRIDPRRPQTRYTVETYFFIPTSLGIHSHTYNREQFFTDIQAYIRFKIPNLTLTALLDADDSRSPYGRLQTLIPKAIAAPHGDPVLAELSYELRLFACLVRAALARQVRALCKNLSTLRAGLTDRTEVNSHHSSKSNQAFSIETTAGAMARDIQSILAALRDMGQAVQDPRLPHWLRDVHQYVEEYVSLSVESQLTFAIDSIDGVITCRDNFLKRQANDDAETLTTARQHLAGVLVAETVARADWPEHPYAAPHGDETYLFRLGLLKKFIMSVLFIDISKAKESRHLNIFAAIAAGVAMLFATTAALVMQKWYTINSSPFIMMLILSYILKDRIKEWLKVYFAAKLTPWLWDYNVRLLDPRPAPGRADVRAQRAVPIGRCREAFCYLPSDDVPAAVLRRRHANAHSALELDSSREVVLRYTKEIRLSGQAIAMRHGRLQAINDIMRFNVSRFLGRAGDPQRSLRWFDSLTGQVVSVSCPKLYHINVVVLVRAEGGGPLPHIERVRVIVDKRGIRRLERA